jgi:Domain of unknown function (DUF3127)
MEITGKVVQTLPVLTGMGKSGEWKKSSFVIETQEKFPKKVCFTVWKDLVDQAQRLTEGQEVNVSFDVESREYQGKWFTDAKAWKISAGSGGSSSSRPSSSTVRPEAPPMSEPPPMGSDDLPF